MKTGTHLQNKYWNSEHGFRSYSHPIVAFFSRQRWNFVSKTTPLNEIERGLDVGCGSGFSNIYAEEFFQCVGCDFSPHMLAYNKKNRVVQADARMLPFKNEGFDLVFCWELLHHMAEPGQVIREMARVSSRWVIIFEPNPFNPIQLLFAFFNSEHRWVLKMTKKYLRGLLRENGLKIIKETTVGTIFPNKTPGWMFKILKTMPFEVPYLGISNLFIARVEGKP